MPIDISTYLNKVKTEPGFNAVRGAVADASETIATALFAEEDIEEELNVIRTGVYGRDIREAIYSALNKLSEKQPVGSDGPFSAKREIVHRGTFPITGVCAYPEEE